MLRGLILESLDEIRMVAREMLVKEMQRHAGDGLGTELVILNSTKS